MASMAIPASKGVVTVTTSLPREPSNTGAPVSWHNKGALRRRGGSPARKNGEFEPLQKAIQYDLNII